MTRERGNTRARCPGGCGRFAAVEPATSEYPEHVYRCESCADQAVYAAEIDAEHQLYRTGPYSQYAGIR